MRIENTLQLSAALLLAIASAVIVIGLLVSALVFYTAENAQAGALVMPMHSHRHAHYRHPTPSPTPVPENMPVCPQLLEQLGRPLNTDSINITTCPKTPLLKQRCNT